VIEKMSVARISEADLQALEPVLYRFALRATRDGELSRDLAQDALVTALAQAESFAGRSTLRTWVIGILSHKLLDHFRRSKAVPAQEGDDPDLLAAPSDEDIERVVAARQQLQLVEQALGRLPERERLAVMLKDVEGLESEECCNVLEVSATHLRVLLHRGRNRLRRALEHE
jgi:RNA polymerase sigma factor (sigma-70 family)